MRPPRIYYAIRIHLPYWKVRHIKYGYEFEFMWGHLYLSGMFLPPWGDR